MAINDLNLDGASRDARIEPRGAGPWKPIRQHRFMLVLEPMLNAVTDPRIRL